MSYGWLYCCRLTTRVFLKFGKLVRTDKTGIAMNIVYYSRLVKHYFIKACKAGDFKASCAAIEKAGFAAANCSYYHSQAEKAGFFIEVGESYHVYQPIHAIRFDLSWLKDHFKRLYFPAKPHKRFKERERTRRIIKYKRRKARNDDY